MINLQHVNVKLFLADGQGLDLAPVVPVFHRWIQERTIEGLLLDVADYRHVPAGPGVVLIGHEGDYSVDNMGGRLGVRYNRKVALAGNNQERLRQAAIAALMACQQLENDPNLGGKFLFGGNEIELFVNDRLLVSNDPATRKALEPEIVTFARTLFGTAGYSFSYEEDVRRLFHVSVKTPLAFTSGQLLQNLN